MPNVLMLVDVQNVYYGSKNYSKGTNQVDYEKLPAWLEREVRFKFNLPFNIPTDLHFTRFGYVVQTPRYNGMRFFAFLRKVGYNLRVKSYDETVDAEDWKGTVASMMQMDLLEHAPSYDAVIVVSGSGVFEPAFRAVRKNWPYVRMYLAAWENTLHEEYIKSGDIVDDIFMLTDEVMRTYD